MKIKTKIVAAVLVIALFFCTGCSSCSRACVDMKSDITGGLDRVIRVYTANGDLIAEYEGKIDIEGNAGGYVLFDFNGKRYTYYNCFVESIANIY